MRQRRVTLAVILYIATVASSAYAHHSHPYFYDECKSVTIEGRVEGSNSKTRTRGSFSGWTTERPIPSIGLREPTDE